MEIELKEFGVHVRLIIEPTDGGGDENDRGPYDSYGPEELCSMCVETWLEHGITTGYEGIWESASPSRRRDVEESTALLVIRHLMEVGMITVGPKLAATVRKEMNDPEHEH